MSELRHALKDYLVMRRALGFKLERAGRLLAQFVDFCEQANASTITTKLALKWATLPANGDRVWFAHRLSAVRGFAKHLAVAEPATEVPA